MRDLGARVFDSVFDMLPDEENPSPMVRIHRLHPLEPGPIPGAPGAAAGAGPGFDLFAKLEWMNPFGSVKDRAAWSMIRELESRGALRPASGEDPGRGIVEPTSGNTGLSLAAMASARGYPMRAVVPNKVPAEKKALLKMAGAEVDVVNDALCPSPGMGEGSINLAKTYAKAQSARYVMPNQYESRANSDAHVRTTGPEIWRQTGGRVTHVFTSLGTCGTVTGLATFLRERAPGVKIIAVQPSPGHDVPGIRNTSELGVSALFDASLIHEIMEIEHERAYDAALELSRSEGLFAGPSSGLIFEGARRYLRREKPASGVGVMIFCDSSFKYVSNMLRHHPELAPGGMVDP